MVGQSHRLIPSRTCPIQIEHARLSWAKEAHRKAWRGRGSDRCPKISESRERFRFGAVKPATHAPLAVMQQSAWAASASLLISERDQRVNSCRPAGRDKT